MMNQSVTSRCTATNTAASHTCFVQALTSCTARLTTISLEPNTLLYLKVHITHIRHNTHK